MQTHLSANHSARTISVIRDIKINVYRKRQINVRLKFIENFSEQKISI